MHERSTRWEPSQDEVRRIREELRPLLGELARRDLALIGAPNRSGRDQRCTTTVSATRTVG